MEIPKEFVLGCCMPDSDSVSKTRKHNEYIRKLGLRESENEHEKRLQIISKVVECIDEQLPGWEKNHLVCGSTLVKASLISSDIDLSIYYDAKPTYLGGLSFRNLEGIKNQKVENFIISDK